MPLAPVDRNGTELYYEDSGPPPGSSTYCTIVLVHGALFHGAIFRRVLQYAAQYNLRLVALNMRDSPGSTPLPAKDVAALRAPDRDTQAAMIAARGLEVGAFLAWFARTQDIPRLQPVDEDQTQFTGGLALLGWSSGNCTTLSCLAHILQLPKEDRLHLENYMRHFFIFDPLTYVFGTANPSYEELYLPLYDPAVTIMPEQMGEKLAIWASGYYLHSPEVLSIPTSFSREDVRAGLAQTAIVRPPPHQQPTFLRMTPTEVAEVADLGATLRSHVPMIEIHRATYVENMCRALFNGLVWSRMRTTVVWCDMSVGDVVLAVWDLSRMMAQSWPDGARQVDIQKMEKGNHLDTAPDVYETEDVPPTPRDNKGDSSDEEPGTSSRSHGRSKSDTAGREELDATSVSAEDASRKFRKAERKRHRPRIQYVYPPSPTSDVSPATSPPLTPVKPLSQRLRLLQAELSAMEIELADPSNPLLQQEREAGRDPGDLIKGMVDVKARLEKINKFKDGKGKLMSAVLSDDVPEEHDVRDANTADENSAVKGGSQGHDAETAPAPRSKPADVRDIADMDKRIGELEKIIGSSGTALDEACLLTPLPPPLLPMLTRLNAQLTLLTQPRHVDSISRRLKLLLSDLDRVSNATAHPHGTQRRQSSHHATPASPHLSATSVPVVNVPAALHDQLTPVLTRIAPLLPHIPHILTRLRTLATLHASATSFQSTLSGLEEEQRKVRAALNELERAVAGVENSMKENEEVVKRNVKELDERVEDVGRRVEELHASNI
ncbi:hypothetical protein WOLCODRAFT_164776 [Wolfiporia cocos MD-104 SS10]|uniref:AB hydrolase-1 domain-containing protein n=1 Tax=Wolfiporia cocos (strain MD-104) TaxID=742152 RepID=A0A2H3JQR4_WOLCO|nr:hypothetical protein WOLCODRAFT_164776 [Wolfiporia cocos MD-104 SS10]